MPRCVSRLAHPRKALRRVRCVAARTQMIATAGVHFIYLSRRALDWHVCGLCVIVKLAVARCLLPCVVQATACPRAPPCYSWARLATTAAFALAAGPPNAAPHAERKWSPRPAGSVRNLRILVYRLQSRTARYACAGVRASLIMHNWHTQGGAAK